MEHMEQFSGGFAVPMLLFSLLFLGGWVFGGGTLLWIGGRFIAKAPKATFWRSVGTNVLAVLAGSLCAGLIQGLFAFAAAGAMLLPGFLLGGAAGLLVTWLVIMGMFGVSFGKAILAWLPTLGQALLTVPLLISILLPSLAHVRGLATTVKCQANIKGIATGMSAYVEDPANTNHEYPPDLNVLISQHLILTDHLRCPACEGEEARGYFYLPPAEGIRTMEPASTLILCDYKGRHPNGKRNVLYADYHVASLEAEAFQSELAMPCNAAFAQALRAAEAPK